MAYHFVDAGAHALGKTFVVERGRNGAVCHRLVVNKLVDFCGAHARMYFFLNQVEYACVDYA